MMEFLKITANDHPSISIFLVGLFLLLAYYSRKKHLAIERAGFMVRNQANKVPRHVLDDGYEHAVSQGNEKVFLALLRRIRMAYGHNGVKYGHIVWMLGHMDAGIKPEEVDSLEVPDYLPGEDKITKRK